MDSFSATSRWLFAIAIVGVNVSTASAQYLAERLAPPQLVPVIPVPLVAQPTEPKVFGADAPRSHLWALPSSPFPGTSTPLATEHRAANWQRFVIDVPVLASEADPTRPAFPIQPTSGRAHSVAADPAAPPAPLRFPMLTDPIVVAGDDPTSNQAYSVLTASIALATPNSIPLLRLSVPDPFEYIAIIRLTNAPADNEGPAVAQDRPALAKLPLVDPVK